MERPVEMDVADRLLLIREMDLGDRLRGFVLNSEMDVSVKGAAIWINVDGGLNSRDFWLQQIFVLLVPAFIVGLDTAARLRVQVLVEDVSIVEVPGAGASSDQRKKKSERDQPWSAPKGQTCASASGLFRSTPRQGDRDDTQDCGDCKPISDRPEERGNEVAVAVHVGVSVGRRLANKI